MCSAARTTSGFSPKRPLVPSGRRDLLAPGQAASLPRTARRRPAARRRTELPKNKLPYQDIFLSIIFLSSIFLSSLLCDLCISRFVVFIPAIAVWSTTVWSKIEPVFSFLPFSPPLSPHSSGGHCQLCPNELSFGFSALSTINSDCRDHHRSGVALCRASTNCGENAGCSLRQVLSCLSNGV